MFFLRHSVVVTSITGKSSIVSFRDSAHGIRRERWIADKVVDMNSHSDDVIDISTSIILNDIRLTVYYCEQYEPLETTENGDKFIPSSLKRFLHNLLDCEGKSRTVSDRRCTAIAHAIISSSRPRSFISPLLLGLSMYINCKYASRELIDILCSMSLADDYEEVHMQQFEQAFMSGGDLSYDLSGLHNLCLIMLTSM